MGVHTYKPIKELMFCQGFRGKMAITRRRLLQLGRSQGWVYLAILPIVNLALFLYLLLKAGPSAGHG